MNKINNAYESIFCTIQTCTLQINYLEKETRKYDEIVYPAYYEYNMVKYSF